VFFHIDESGNTGNNLFDKSQSRLSYGVLSSRTNVDFMGKAIHEKMCKKLGVEDLHANQLGIGGLTEIYPLLLKLQRKMDFRFDYYYIDKPFFALVTFFEAVFDAGLNEVVPWTCYWTPMRFLLLHKISLLLDESDLKESWRLCSHLSIQRENEAVSRLLNQVRRKIELVGLDARSKEIIGDALEYGASNPEKMDFGAHTPTMLSPNTICFQFVVIAMAQRLRKKKRKDALGIFVDRQSQFNVAQVDTHEMAKKISAGLAAAPSDQREWFVGHPMHSGLNESDLLRKGVPGRNIDVLNSGDSIGLQIVDIYLWIFNRMVSGKGLSEELQGLAASVFQTSYFDGISLESAARRFSEFENKLPKMDEMTAEQTKFAKDVVEAHKRKVEKVLGRK